MMEQRRNKRLITPFEIVWVTATILSTAYEWMSDAWFLRVLITTAFTGLFLVGMAMLVGIRAAYRRADTEDAF